MQTPKRFNLPFDKYAYDGNLFQEQVSILPSKEDFGYAINKGYIEYLSADAGQIFIRPAGYSQPFSLNKFQDKNLTRLVHNTCKDFLSRKEIYNKIYLYHNNLTKFGVQLVHEIDNDFDKNAVAIILVDVPDNLKSIQYAHIGYIPGSHSRLVRKNLYRISKFGTIYAVNEDKEPYSCTIHFNISKRPNINKRFANILDDE